MTRAFGVHLDGLDGAVAETSGLELAGAQLVPSTASIPMAAVLSPGKPLCAHRVERIPLDGAGLEWPDEAQPTAVLERPTGGRLPLPFLWECFLSDSEVLSGRAPADRAERALALCVRETLVAGAVVDRASAAPEVASPVAIVIPNELDENRQQRLLDACRSEQLEPALLWRPVAAAFAWLERHSGGLARRVSKETSIGSLLCIHVGLDGAEAAWLELIQRPDDVAWVRPARRRPQPDARTLAPSMGREWVERAIDHCLPGADPWIETDRWRALWASPLLLDVFATRVAGPTLASFGFDGQLAQSFVRALLPADPGSSSFSTPPVRGRSWPGTSPSPPHGAGRLLAWARALDLAAPENMQPVGAVVTGAFASLHTGTGLLGEQLVEAVVGSHLPRTECEGTSALPRGALARAAATYLARRNAQCATYLDTLPQMEVLLEERARPLWRSLLQQGEQYVEGGRPWRREPDLGGLAVKANERRFMLELWVEGEEHTRDAEFELPEPPERPVPVALRAEIEPAGGRARIELIPDEPGGLGRRQIRLDWERARPTGETPEEALATYPLKCPRIQPKQAWEGAWYKLESVVRLCQRRRNFGELRRALNVAGHSQQSETVGASEEGISMWRPVNSEGRIHANQRQHQPELDRLLEEIAQEQLGKLERGGWVDPDALVCLGYACARGPAVDRLVGHVLAKRPLIADDTYFLAGCVRTPEQARPFVLYLRSRLESDNKGLSILMKSIGYMLQWREHALDAVPSADARAIVEGCARLIRSVVDPSQAGVRVGHFQLTERNAVVLIAFMLRRRIVDDAFIAPQGPLAIEIKALLERARYRLSSACPSAERMFAVGGMVNLPRLLEQVIKYIDEEGTGTLVTE